MVLLAGWKLNWNVLLLLLKMVLIPALIIAGFVGLKAVMDLFDGPSDKEVRQWEANAELMQKGVESATVTPAGSTEEIFIHQEFLEERVSRWEKTESHLRAAEALLQRGIDDDAVMRLEQALKCSPDSREAQERLLKVYMRSGSCAEAIPLCIRLLDQDSTQWDIKMDLLRALQATEETALCLLLSGQMLLQQPSNVRVLEIVAYAHAAEGNADEALGFYKRILEYAPNHLLALEGCGVIYQWQKEWLTAVPYYLELLKLDPKAEHYLALAISYAQQDEAGKTVIFLGQAYSLYGVSTVSPWVSLPELNPVRETPDFRSFAGRIVGERVRDGIEDNRRREIQKKILLEDDEFKPPSGQDLELLKPSH